MRRALVFPDGSVAYFLVRKVDIPQNRTLLPSDVDFGRAVEIGASGFINAMADQQSGE